MTTPEPSIALPGLIAEEERALQEVTIRLRKGREVFTLDTRGLLEELDRLREEIGSTPDEERPPLLQQYERLVYLIEGQGKSITGEDVDPRRPYFAHMRLREGGREREVFLGRATRLDQGLRIVDWRNAPVSAVFYRYQEGDEYDEEMGGRHIEGTLVARRILRVEDGTLLRIQCPQGVFTREAEGWRHQAATIARLHGGQGEAFRILDGTQAGGRRLGAAGGIRAEKHLPDVSALLDPEQFGLVSDRDAQLLVVRGVAGSGKTTVMLHRMAFLAYDEPHHFRAERMLCIVWGRALRDYISRMLKGLGLSTVPVRTFGEWAQEQIQRLFPTLPRDRAEDTPGLLTRFKLHPAMMRMLEDWVRTRRRPATAHQVLEDWLELLTSRDVLRGGVQKYAPGAFSESELDRIVRWTSRQVELLGARRSWDAEQLDRQGQQEPQDEEYPEDLGPPEPAIDPEDEPLLLRLYQLRVGPLPYPGTHGGPIRYRHIAIDEVQDLSPLEVRVLLDCTDSRRSITLSGDTQQHVLTEAGFASWEEFFSHLGVRGTQLSTLKVSYRSPRPVLELALSVLGPLAEDPDAPLSARDGAPVETFRFGDHGEGVAFLADALHDLERTEPLASVALLARSPEIADLYWKALVRAGLRQAHRVEDQDFRFAPGIEVCDVAQAKGLEFDYVILLDVSAGSYPDTPTARRLLHVGMTRATWQLWVTFVGTPSPLLPTL